MYEAVLTNKMIIWDVLEDHLTFLATTVENLQTLECTTAHFRTEC